MYSHKPVLIFGGTGSLGTTLVQRFLEKGKIPIVFSRDEAKQHKMDQTLENELIGYVIGDVRDYESVERAIRQYNPDVIINAAAMKQVPACEHHPYQALQTNTIGTYNIVRAVEALGEVRKVLSVSTDKACKPVNAYGMTKALQERIHLNGRGSIYNCVRYGNVLESTGSVIPIFKKRLAQGKMLKITDKRMTRFLLSLNQAVDLISRALDDNEGGKIFIPKVPATNILDLAKVMMKMSKAKSETVILSGIRPGEKIDEILVSEEELWRTEDLGDVFVVHNTTSSKTFEDLDKEYSSKSDLMDRERLEEFLEEHNVI